MKDFYTGALAVLLALSCFALPGCHENDIKPEPGALPGKETPPDTEPEPEPVDGGEIDKTDYCAPKSIVSKDISTYYVRFCLEGEWAPGHRDEFLEFEIKPDENGILTASEKVTGVSREADKELLSSLQGIIDKYKLVSKNGEYRITAGIDPYLFGPCTMDVSYASGEELYFTHDNEPYDEWAIRTYLTFAEWFADKGDSSLLPEGYEEMVSDISFSFNDTVNGRSYDYSIEEERDEYGRLIVRRTIDGKTESVEVYSPYILFGSISGIVSNYDAKVFDKTLSEDRALDPDIRLYIRFEDGHEISVVCGDESGTDEIRFLIADLMDELDTVFKN